MSAIVIEERPDSADATALINELQIHLESFYPPESRHGFGVERLVAEGVAFFVLRVDGVAAGCGGILLVGKKNSGKGGGGRPAVEGGAEEETFGRGEEACWRTDRHQLPEASGLCRRDSHMCSQAAASKRI